MFILPRSPLRYISGQRKQQYLLWYRSAFTCRSRSQHRFWSYYDLQHMLYWVILEPLWLHCLTMSYSSLLPSEASCQTSTYNYIGLLKFYSLAQWIWLTYIWCKIVARWQIWITSWLRPEINEAYRLRYVLVCAREEEVRDGVGYGAR